MSRGMLSIFVIAVMAVVLASTSKVILISAMPECCTRMSPEILRHLHLLAPATGCQFGLQMGFSTVISAAA